MPHPKKYYILTGEASGDLHATNLVKAISNLNPLAEFRSWGGGDLMMAAGVPVAKHYRELAFMGFVEVAKNLRTILQNFKHCKSDIQAYQPDVLILVDYPGFNLRMAKWAKRKGLTVIYYIAPQLWAWNKGRIKIFKSYVDQLLAILPFEEDFFKKEGYQKVTYVGHPLLDHTTNFRKQKDFLSKNQLSDKPIIALLPGSRKQEIKSMLPTFLKIIQKFPDYQFVIGGAPGQEVNFYQSILTQSNIERPILFNQTYQLLAHSHAALVTSGTATLEAALFKVPQVVCYKGNKLSYLIAKRLVQVKYISLVNLIAQKKVVTELIQQEFNLKNIEIELQQLLTGQKKEEMNTAYVEIQTLLGEGKASVKAAQLIDQQFGSGSVKSN